MNYLLEAADFLQDNPYAITPCDALAWADFIDSLDGKIPDSDFSNLCDISPPVVVHVRELREAQAQAWWARVKPTTAQKA